MHRRAGTSAECLESPPAQTRDTEVRTGTNHMHSRFARSASLSTQTLTRLRQTTYTPEKTPRAFLAPLQRPAKRLTERQAILRGRRPCVFQTPSRLARARKSRKTWRALMDAHGKNACKLTCLRLGFPAPPPPPAGEMPEARPPGRSGPRGRGPRADAAQIWGQCAPPAGPCIICVVRVRKRLKNKPAHA
jgi:hypothetical protein